MNITKDKEVDDSDKPAFGIDYLNHDPFNWMDEDDEDLVVPELHEEVSHYLIVYLTLQY